MCMRLYVQPFASTAARIEHAAATEAAARPTAPLLATGDDFAQVVDILAAVHAQVGVP